jgi:O-antigen/teichoic acid export membrane protein
MTAIAAAVAARAPVGRIALRYALSTGGPVSVSAAHLLASLLILHALPSKDFGTFAFVLVVVPLCLSASGALLNVSLPHAAARQSQDELAVFAKANLVYCGFSALLCGALAYGGGASGPVAASLGVYGGAMCARWFARALAYVDGHPARVAASDFCYSILLIAALAGLWSFGQLRIANVALALAASAIAGTGWFGTDYLRRQFIAVRTVSLKRYAATWRGVTRWSLLGVVLTEATANAHAYVVTFLAGSQSFALLAVGALFLRPVSLCLSALCDVERPFMALSIAGGETAKAERCMREFRAMGAAIWVGTVLLCACVLGWFPEALSKQNYRPGDVAAVVALWAAIMAMRLLRTPESVLLQAAGEFRVLARTTYLSSAVSVGLTLGLLLTFGAVASLAGILAGDAVMTVQVLLAARRWRRGHD